MKPEDAFQWHPVEVVLLVICLFMGLFVGGVNEEHVRALEVRVKILEARK